MQDFIFANTKRIVILLFSLVISLVALTIFLDISTIDNLWIKTSTTLLIFVFSIVAFFNAPRILRFGIPVSLFFCTIGDFIILFDFNAGLVLFLLAHIVLLVTFTMFSRKISVLGIALSFTVSTLIFFVFLFSSLGGMLVPVAVYSVVISLMLSSALSVHITNVSDYRKVMIILGAAFFYLSDMVIAFHEFWQTIPYMIIINYPVYFIGLTCLAAFLYPVKISRNA